MNLNNSIAKFWIKKATFRDIPEIVCLLEELFRIEEDFVFDKQKQSNALKILIDEENATLLCAMHDNHLVGFASMQKIVSTAMGGYCGLIEDVVVKDGYRAIGIGNMLIEKLQLEAKKQLFTRVQLLCDETNTKAQEFYLKHGFKKSKMVGWYKS